jgi:hypothetical protein
VAHRSVAPTIDDAERLLSDFEDALVRLGDGACSDIGDALWRLERIARAWDPREIANSIERPYGDRRPSIADPWTFEAGGTSADRSA